MVFGQDGAVALSNQAARKLWPETVEPGASARGLGGAIMQWRDLTAPSLFWNDLADYIGSFGPREPWQGELRFLDGRVVTCKVTPLIANGATLLGFHPPQTPELDHSPAAARFG